MSDGFTKVRAMSFPRQVLAGHGVIEQTGTMCEEFELEGTALIVTGQTTGELAAKQVEQILQDKGFEVQKTVVGEASRANLVKVEEVSKDVKAAFLLAAGGGSKTAPT